MTSTIQLLHPRLGELYKRENRKIAIFQKTRKSAVKLCPLEITRNFTHDASTIWLPWTSTAAPVDMLTQKREISQGHTPTQGATESQGF